MGRPPHIRSHRRSPQNQSRHTPSRQKNTHHHNQRNHDGRNPHRNQLGRRLRSPQPSPSRKSGKQAHNLQLPSPRNHRLVHGRHPRTQNRSMRKKLLSTGAAPLYPDPRRVRPKRPDSNNRRRLVLPNRHQQNQPRNQHHHRHPKLNIRQNADQQT